MCALRQSRTWGLGFSNADGVRRPRDLVARACDALAGASGLKLAPYVAQSYDDLASAVCGGEVGFAWLPPVPAIELQDHGIAEPLVVAVRENASTYHCALVVREGAAIASLAELEGRRIAWITPESASGYIVPRVHIAAAGHDVRHFFASEVFLHDHRAVVDAVARGDVDVGATFCGVGADGKVVSGSWLTEVGMPVRKVRALCTFGPIPGDAIVAATDIPAHARSAVTRFLLQDTGDSKALSKLLRTSGLRIATREHFDPLRHVLRTAHARGYDALPPASRRAILVRSS
jgi:phosphonate transport system substrate-binding protein